MKEVVSEKVCKSLVISLGDDRLQRAYNLTFSASIYLDRLHSLSKSIQASIFGTLLL